MPRYEEYRKVFEKHDPHRKGMTKEEIHAYLPHVQYRRLMSALWKHVDDRRLVYVKTTRKYRLVRGVMKGKSRLYSPVLAKIVGKESGPRVDAMKAIWEYAKKHGYNQGRMLLGKGDLCALFEGLEEVDGISGLPPIITRNLSDLPDE